MGFQDHFSSRAEGYARARPRYPAALFDYLADLAPTRLLAWDCGTGSGQAAVDLADRFERVLGTDPSPAQLAQAQPHPRVSYCLGRENESGLADYTVDLVTAAQAAHWFDLAAFGAEARRVLRPGGVVAVWCYALCRITPEIDVQVDHFYRETIGPWWPPERRHTETGYRELAFPFTELPFPALTIEVDWTLDQFGDYVRTWSAVSRFVTARGLDPVGPLLDDLMSHWSGRQRITWPLAGRLGQVA